jgi:hypothetical protein
MPTERLPLQRPPRGRLTASQEQELWLGPSPNLGSLFTDAAHVHAAWLQHRARLLQQYGSHGRRPQAWWIFEARIPYPGYDHEQSFLFEQNFLSEAEKVELLQFWRAEYAVARKPGFSCASRGEILHGADARRFHLAWADVPCSLVEKWNAEAPSDA